MCIAQPPGSSTPPQQRHAETQGVLTKYPIPLVLCVPLGHTFCNLALVVELVGLTASWEVGTLSLLEFSCRGPTGWLMQWDSLACASNVPCRRCLLVPEVATRMLTVGLHSDSDSPEQSARTTRHFNTAHVSSKRMRKSRANIERNVHEIVIKRPVPLWICLVVLRLLSGEKLRVATMEAKQVQLGSTNPRPATIQPLTATFFVTHEACETPGNAFAAA